MKKNVIRIFWIVIELKRIFEIVLRFTSIFGFDNNKLIIFMLLPSNAIDNGVLLKKKSNCIKLYIEKFYEKVLNWNCI